MTKTHDEIKKGLGCCNEWCNIESCPYWEDSNCTNNVRNDALALIQQLEAELKDAQANHQHTIDIAEKQKEQIGKLKSVIVKMNKEKVHRWISVEELLPEAHADGSVDAELVTDGEFIHMAYYAHGQWIFCESGEMKGPMWNTVTHWMPLPEPPKEDSAC